MIDNAHPAHKYDPGERVFMRSNYILYGKANSRPVFSLSTKLSICVINARQVSMHALFQLSLCAHPANHFNKLLSVVLTRVDNCRQLPSTPYTKTRMHLDTFNPTRTCPQTVLYIFGLDTGIDPPRPQLEQFRLYSESNKSIIDRVPK